MGWGSATRKTKQAPVRAPVQPTVETAQIDWARLVSLDFETYFDGEYTLKKMSTSEYIRDPRFKAQMVGIKIGNKKTKVVTGARIKSELAKINWATHSLLCHNTHFDGLILSHHFGIVPAYYYCSLSMARGLHSNEIGAGLDEVAKFYGGEGKVDGVLEKTRGELNWSKQLVNEVALYCERDVEEMYRIFVAMQAQYPAKEMQLIHLTMRMFCAPVLRVDIPRVEAEYVREYDRRQKLLLSLLDPRKYDHILDGKDKKLEGEERDIRITKKVVGSTPRFVELFADMGIPAEKLPRKISPAWMKKSKEERQDFIDSKWAYAFAKDDLEFLAMPGNVWDYFPDLDPNYDGHVMLAAAHSTKLQQLIDTRIAVKSTTNITRAERFLKAGANGWRLPVGYAYYRASTGRFGGNNKMNMQNLMRGGELRLSILADKGHAIAVADSGQIEARVNAWLWDQDDLLDAFRHKRDVYSEFATAVYGRTITKNDKNERHVGKTATLGLGYQMGATKFQLTLAKGALGGPPVNFTLDECHRIVNLYRRDNFKIVQGWKQCASWIEHMADPDAEPAFYKCLEVGHGYIRLPNGMCLKYPDLRKAPGEKGWDEWSYQSGAARKKIYGGLLCLAGDTEVLTNSGWKQLLDVTESDLLWDGREWVTHDGVVYQGDKEIIDFGGVWMTPDHLVSIGDEWHEAQKTSHDEATSSFAGHFASPEWFAPGGGAGWQRRAQDVVDVPVRLRPNEDHDSDGIPQREYEIVRVRHEADAEREQDDPWHGPTPGIRSLARHARPVPTADASSVQKLRCEGNQRLLGVARVRSILARHAAGVPPRTDLGAQEQWPGVQPTKLYMGDAQGAVQQQTLLGAVYDGPRSAVDRRGNEDQRTEAQHAVLPPEARLAARSPAIPVYDILNAGPDRCFTVRGADRRPFLVHNCENLVQALARIIVMEQMLMIDAKYPVVMTTHDEVVAHPKVRQADKCYEFMHQCMTTPLWWCEDIPLAAEGGHALNYSK